MNSHLLLALVLAFASVTTHGTDLVTRGAGALDVAGGGESFAPRLSRDGSNIVFLSQAANLVTNRVGSSYLGIYLHDRGSSNTVLRSIGPGGIPAQGNSAWPSVSTDGRIIAFVAEDDRFYPGDSNSWADILVHDISVGTNRLVTGYRNGPVPPNSTPQAPAMVNRTPLITADGRYVFFESTADLVNAWPFPDANGVADVFRYDLETRDMLRISTNYFRFSEPRPATLAGITPNGERVAIIVTPPELPNGSVIHVHDLASGAIHSTSAVSNYFRIGATQFEFTTRSGVLSDDGSCVYGIIEGYAPPEGENILFKQELASGVLVAVATNVSVRSHPQVSADGRYVAYEQATNIYRWDSTNEIAVQVNVTVSGADPANGKSREPRMTRNGKGIVFTSTSTNLTGQLVPTNIVQIYLRDMDSGQIHLITAKPHGSGSDETSEGAAYDVAEDLSFVVFASPAGDLVANDLNRQSDIFIRRVQDQATELVSARHPSFAHRRTGFGHATVNGASISSNGQAIAMLSMDSELVPNDTNDVADAFVADLTSGAFATAGFSTNAARTIALSGDGRYVVHASGAILSTRNGLYRFDRVAGTNELIQEFTRPNDGFATPAVNQNGDLVAFRFQSSSLTSLALLNLSDGTTEFQTNSASPVNARGYYDALFTPDSRFVVFTVGETNHAYDRLSRSVHEIGGGTIALSGNSRFVILGTTPSSWPYSVTQHDLIARTNSQVFTYPYRLMNPSSSHDARLAVFDSSSPRPTAVLVDFSNGSTSAVHVSSSPGGLVHTHWPVISSDGRFIAYLRTAFTGNGERSPAALLLRDRLLGTTAVISSAPEMNGRLSAGRPYFAANGRTLVFSTMSDTVVAGDYNDRRDVFVLHIAASDTDQDGLDDEWEIAYFNELSRNGDADADGDLVSDRGEFLAGTDPTNGNSVFRVLAVRRLNGEAKQVLWTGNPAANYRVEVKNDLSDSTWTTLTGTISWSESTGSITDTATASAAAFYRVIRLP